MNIRKIIVAAGLAGVAATAFTGCSGNGSTVRGESDSIPVVTVSIAPHAWIVKEIAGDRVKVAVLMPNGGDPETYDPSISDLRNLSSSRLYLMAGGIEFEPTIASRLPQTVKAVDLSEGIVPVYGTHEHAHNGHDTHEHEGERPDPHTWSSLKNGRIIATNTARALIDADPEGRSYYKSRLEALTARIDSLDSLYTDRLKPLEKTTFLIWHPSLSYLARDYGLKQKALGAEHKEHSVKSLKSLLDSAEDAAPSVMFLQPESDTPVARSTASQLGVEAVVINPLNPDWLGEITRTLDALVSTEAATNTTKKK